MQWDYIVIGAGSAGCALAYELARSGTSRVLVLEAGGRDNSLFIKIPAGQIRAIKANSWPFVSQPDPSRNGRVESWARGRVLGGSSSVNGMMYVRGAASDFDRWASLGNRAWRYSDVLPMFRDIERSDQAGERRGHEGPLCVQTVKKAHPLTEAFVRSATACGIPFNPDYNAATQEGIAYAQLSQRNGFRCSAAGAFLEPLLGRANLKLLLNSTVQRIHVQYGRATEVSFVCDGVRQAATAQDIVLCAGAINSPQLLMLSGIGDPQELERHGIGVQVDSPEVGRNLQDHPLINLTYRTRIPSNNLTEGIGQKLQIALDYLFRRSGPVANLFEAVAFLKSTVHAAEPDIQLHFLSVGYSRVEAGGIRLLDHPAVSVYVNKSHPRSRGRIRLTSGHPHDAPLIGCRLLEDEADIETLVNGIGVVRRIMSTAPIAELIEEEVRPGAACADAQSLRTYIQNHAEIAYHPVSTCRMGVDSNAVVTPELQVKGVENLWVADASVMPDLISGNTNAACMMIGMKLGRYLNARRRESQMGSSSHA